MTCMSFCVLPGPESVGIVICGDWQLEFSQTATKTVGGSLDCCHETWRPRSLAFLHSFCLVLSQAKLLERFSSAAWCRSSFQTLPRLCSCCLLFLFSPLLRLWLLTLSLFPSSMISLPISLSKGPFLLFFSYHSTSQLPRH